MKKYYFDFFTNGRLIDSCTLTAHNKYEARDLASKFCDAMGYDAYEQCA